MGIGTGELGLGNWDLGLELVIRGYSLRDINPDELELGNGKELSRIRWFLL